MHARIKSPTIIAIILTVFACSITILSCILLYRYDNKYTRQGPQAINGILFLDEEAFESYLSIYLVNGWAFYNGRLLTPEDFENDAPLPDEYIYIGQYGGFEAGNPSGSPHGSASYRLIIAIPDEMRTYILELPEIYSAYRLYINGREVATMGNPDPDNYKPETRNRTITFEAQEKIEILIAVTDFSYIYSGMVYPPAFGEPEAVLAVLNARLVLRSTLCAAALTIGIISMLIGIMSRKKVLTAVYVLICLFYTGYTSYSIIHTLKAGFYPFYAVEIFSFCAMLLAVILLQADVCGLKKNWWRHIFILCGAFVCIVALILPSILPSGNLQFMIFYSNLITTYKWIAVGFITVTAVWSTFKKTIHSRILLCGILIFDCALVLDRVLPMYEPIITGWFPELAGFILLLFIGSAIGQEVAEQYKKNAVLEERTRSLERLSQMQHTYYPLLQEKIEEAKAARHDLRHHMITITGFLNQGKNEKLTKYVSEYRAAFLELEPISYSENDVANVLAHHYTRLAKQHRIDLTLQLDISHETNVSDADLCSLLSNLLENAVEACRRQTDSRRFITLSAGYKGSFLALYMENSVVEVTQDTSGFLSSKAEGRIGYGLESIKTITHRYNGVTEFRYDRAANVFYSTILLDYL